MTTENRVENRVESMSKTVSNRCRNVENRVENRVETDWKSASAVAASLGVEDSTVLRWIGRGIRGVRLEATRVGGRWRVTPGQLERFFAAQTARAVGRSDAVPAPPTRSVWDRDARAHQERVAKTLGG